MRTHIKAIKYGILGFTFLLLCILLIYTQPQQDLVPLLEKYGNKHEEEKAKAKQSLETASVADLKQTVMEKPNFLGEDINQKLWTLKAIKAIQTGDVVSGVTSLYDVMANTLSAKNSQVDYMAKQGEYLPAKQLLKLSGDVKISSKTFVLETQGLEYDLKNAYAKTDVPIKVKSDNGYILGDSMESFNNADKIVVTGNVKAVLYNRSK